MHDLDIFMQQATEKMASDYRWISSKVKDHPSLAGNQGEKHWKELFKNWLPSYYFIETNGKILLHTGDCIPKEIDILIIDSSYPKGLLNNNYYLASSVVAAFECKLTLKKEHIEDAIKTSVMIKRKLRDRQYAGCSFISEGSPYKELHSPIIYGLLAHSHTWDSPSSTPVKNITDSLIQYDKEIVQHPKEMLDLICVSDTATWVAQKITGGIYSGANFTDLYQTPSTVYSAGHLLDNEEQKKSFTPIGNMIANLLMKLAYKNEKLRNLSEYFQSANIAGNSKGLMRKWELDIYSEEVKEKILKNRPYVVHFSWDEWKSMF